MKEKKLLTSKMIQRKVLTEKGDKHRYSTWERYKLKDNFYFILKGVKGNKEIILLLQQFLNEEIITNYCKKSKEPILDLIDKLFYYLYAHMMGMSNLIMTNQIAENPSLGKKRFIPVDEKDAEHRMRKNIETLPLKKQVAILISIYSGKFTAHKFSKELSSVFSKLSKRAKELQEMSDFFV
jgi:hypothetical protein